MSLVQYVLLESDPSDYASLDSPIVLAVPSDDEEEMAELLEAGRLRSATKLARARGRTGSLTDEPSGAPLEQAELIVFVVHEDDHEMRYAIPSEVTLLAVDEADSELVTDFEGCLDDFDFAGARGLATDRSAELRIHWDD